MKLAVIGGGSTYTPELVDGVARLSDDIKVEELVLVDPDETRLSVVGPVSSRIMRTYGHPAQLAWTTSLDAGLDGAGAVLLQLRVGGQAARRPGSATKPGRWNTAASARRPPAPADSPRLSGPSRSCWTSPSEPGSAPFPRRGSSTSPTRWGS